VGLGIKHVFLGLTLLLAGSWQATAQEVVDRIVARVENDVILLSEVKALSRYEILLEGKSESDAENLERLIDQWVVRTEAEAAHFKHPSDEEIQKEMERVANLFNSPAEYEGRKKQSGLSDAEIRSLVAAQLYRSNYVDSRFRPAVQVDSKAVEDFYESAVVPRAKAHGVAPPTLEASRETIQAALEQQRIDEQAERWLKESRARLQVEKLLDEGTK
jgi:hypothetical protein